MPPGACECAVARRSWIFTKDVANSQAAGAVFVLADTTDVGVSGDMRWESGTYKVTVKSAVVETRQVPRGVRKKNGKWLDVRRCCERAPDELHDRARPRRRAPARRGRNTCANGIATRGATRDRRCARRDIAARFRGWSALRPPFAQRVLTRSAPTVTMICLAHQQYGRRHGHYIRSSPFRSFSAPFSVR